MDLKHKEVILDNIGKVNSKVLTMRSRIELIDSIMFEKVDKLFGQLKSFLYIVHK